MDHLEAIFLKNELIYDGSDTMVIELFEKACFENNYETIKALIFPRSPILSAVLNNCKGTFLHFLCSFEDINIALIQLLIDFGINIDAQNKFGSTALHVSTRCEVVKLLLKNGANQDIRDKDGLIPIQFSLFAGNLELAEQFLKDDKLPNAIEVDSTDERCQHLVKCLMQKGKVLNHPGTNYSYLLHFLMLQNAEEMFEYIANNTNFDVNAISSKGNSLFNEVSSRGTPRMIRALVNIGADLDAESDLYEIPLNYALKNRRIENVHCLLDCGASVNKVAKYKMDTNSPLHYAVCIQSFEIVEKLLKMGADVNALTFHRTPLLLACGSIYSRKWCQSYYYGLRSVFFRDHPWNVIIVDKDTPFSVKIVEILLDYGADIEAKNVSNRTALDQACRYGKLDIVKLLLSRGAKVNQGDVSTLHHAVRGENADVAKLILDQGVDVNCRCAPEKMLWNCLNYVSPPPRTALECAINFIHDDSNCKNIVELLIEYGANVNVADPVHRQTPLHLAFLTFKRRFFIIEKIENRPDTIKLLLKHNSDVNALNSKKFVPLKYVTRNYALVMTGEHPTRNYSNPLKPDLMTLVAFIALKIEKKEFLIEKNLKLLEDKYVRPIYLECKNELSLLMKKNICESRNFSFFNILSKDIQSLGSALINEDISQVLTKGEYKEDFPIYGEYLEDRILESSIRQSLVNIAIILFRRHIDKNILAELVLKILNFFNFNDFKNFAKACFVDL